MLEFYYDFLDKYVDRRDFELIQIDTDSMYMALATKTIDEAARPETMEDFQTYVKNGCPGTHGATAHPVSSNSSSNHRPMQQILLCRRWSRAEK